MNIIIYWAENAPECVSENPFFKVSHGGGGMPPDPPSYGHASHVHMTHHPPPLIYCMHHFAPLPKCPDKNTDGVHVGSGIVVYFALSL